MRPDFNNLESVTVPNLAGDSIGQIIGKITPWIYAAIGLVLLMYLIMGGFQFMTSGGDPKASEAAKKKITNAVIGFIIVFVSYWIVVVLSEVLDIWKITNIF